MYRKFTADHIFTGREILPEAAVLITDTTGTIMAIVDPKDAGDGIETLRGMLTPGFTNAHCHLELSHLKGRIPEKTGLVEFVQQVMNTRASSTELKMQGMTDAEAEMYKNGIVAVGDICNTHDSIPIKQQSRLRWHNFIEVSGFSPDSGSRRLKEMKKVFEQFKSTGTDQKTTFSPHAPYSVSKNLFQLLNDETAGEIISIHNQECAAENDLFLQKEGGLLALYKNLGIDISTFEPPGKSSFQSWLPWFTLSQSIISVHNTFTGPEDVAYFNNRPQNNSHQLFYCVCIHANQYIEQQLPPIQLLLKSGCNMVLGTDSYASNHYLNIFEEIKTIQRETNYTIPLKELLQWATINGAKALQLDHIVGSFEIGKKPGIVLIEGLNGLQTTQQSFAGRVL